MDVKGTAGIAYVVSPSSKVAFPDKRLVVNFVPRGECTNRCVFCAPNIDAIQQFAQGRAILEREPSVGEMVGAVSEAYEEHPDCSEIIVTGTIGEPLIYLDKLLQFMPEVKTRTSLPVRLNTNGHATIIRPEYSAQEVCQMLESAGLDSVAVSLNAITERNYDFLCRPKQPSSFVSALDFIRESSQVGIETFVSFVDYFDAHPDLPRLDRGRIAVFCGTLGLSENQIVYRPLIE
ncbi:MAG: radical SAM protein [Nanoarchaeota archaeon]|nr:radical SAM protein [Nanoarchaeota archaeon]MBU1104213.1 radical SAM protein [Nanoarchaeota archaeon]